MRLSYDQYGVNRFYLGSGGSAFNDGGFGAVRAMNIFDFKHENGESIPIDHPITFADVKKVQSAKVIDRDFVNSVSVLMPCDVVLPLLGPRGASYVFGPQKGAKPEDLPILEKNMEHIMKVYLKAIHTDNYCQEIFDKMANTPGTGAAGGNVAALISVLGERAKTVSGMDFVADLTALDEKI